MYRYLHLDFAVYVADMATDACCFLLFACDLNWFFALLQLVLLACSVRRQLKIARPQEVLDAFLASRRQGFFTDEYIQVVQTHRLVACPWSFLMQFYSCAFVRSGWFPVFLFSFSMASSLYGAVHASYVLFHLDNPTTAMDTKVSAFWEWDA